MRRVAAMAALLFVSALLTLAVTACGSHKSAPTTSTVKTTPATSCAGDHDNDCASEPDNDGRKP